MTIICTCGIILKKITNKHLNTKRHLLNCNNQQIIENIIFDECQLKFINSNIENSIVIGNPGCGKTKTIIEYCINKYNKKIIKSSNDFLILTFSKKAQLDFISRSNLLNNLKIFNNKNIKTFHSFALSIYKILNYKTNTQSVNIIILATYNLLLNISIEELLKIFTYKFIIIDEAQDINENQYNLVKLISNKLNIPLILVGDPNQNIYQFQGGNDKYLLNHSNIKYNLINNYRSTNEIINFLNYLRPHNNIEKMNSIKNNSNNKPLIYCNNVDNILNHIKNELLNNEYNLENIDIIGPVKLSKINNQNIGLQLICNFLSKNNIKFIKHFTDPEENNFNNNQNIQIIKDHVNILTSWGSKGLEFDKVLVINYHYTTQSKIPTEKEHNIHKYVWYVSLSRAINKLIIYVDNEKKIFPEIKNVPKELYVLDGNLNYPKLPYKDIIKPLIFNITNIINDNNYFNENNLYEFNQQFPYSIIEEKLFNINNSDIYEFEKYACLYGLFIEKLFTFYYYKNHNKIIDFINDNKNMINNILFIENNTKYYIIYNKLKKLGFINNNILNIDLIDKNILNNEDLNFINYCYNKMNTNNIIIYINSIYIEYDKDYLIKLYNDLLLNNINVENQIFKIVLYEYQYKNECSNILKNNFSKHLKSLEKYYIKLNTLSLESNNFNFQYRTAHKNINLIGIIDILQNNKIIELKFVNKINEKHIIQLLLYYNNLFIDWKQKKDIEIWNLLDGYKYIIKFNDNITNWKLNCFICNILDVKMKDNIFILDLETNTINEPFNIPSNNEIIERYIYEYNFNYVISQGLIKNNHKLITSHINGIFENDLKIADNNLDIFKNDMKNIMLYCDKPLFIAHNGIRFDFPILYHYNLLNKELIKELDSIHFIKLFIKKIPDTILNNKLIDLYNYLYNEDYVQVHRAKEDVELIIKILKKLNLKSSDLLNMIKII